MPWSCGRWTVKEGLETAFVDAWTEFARWSAQEFRGGRAWLLRDRAAPRTFLSVGPWPDNELMASWRGSPGFATRVAGLRRLLESFEPMTLDEVATSG
jgi:quinol monooxygenase YgiN